MVRVNSYSKLKCPRCVKTLSIVPDDCDTKNNLIVGYCYDQSHPRLKIRTVSKLRMKMNQPMDVNFSMSGLHCIFCGGQLWMDENKSHNAGHRYTGDCKVCKIGVQYLGKSVKGIITYDEILRVKVIKTNRFD